DDDEAARDRLRYVDRDLKYVGLRLDSATVVEPPAPGGAVAFGSTVLVRDTSGVAHRYTIVGEDEGDPDAGLVSWVSPLARVLEGARPGETAVWRRPAGDLTLTVEAVE
ncbi:MAG TPA: GreA/GreB family elongation factor, partial [Thermoleophilia bacterium]|nr:GreA/GreB family elongation factor [Thermoleophilia bacterium]